MAKTKFYIQSSKNPANVYLRLSIGRNQVFKRKTGYIINPKNWNSTTNLPKQGGDEQQKKLTINLNKLANKIEENYNNEIPKGTIINGEWLLQQINAANNKKESFSLEILINYIQYYIDNLPYKSSLDNRGVSIRTIQKYKTVKRKVSNYEIYSKRKYQVKDVNLRFSNNFIKYLREVDNLSLATTGKYLKCLKTICIDAKRNDVETHSQLDLIKGFSVKGSHTYLSFEELDIIRQKNFEREALNNARDWLLIGCYIGQRVSDLLKLTERNIHFIGSYRMIVLTQIKTGKEVAIPIHDNIKPLFEKRNWNFPKRISAKTFNEHLKDIAKLAGINELMEGSKKVCIDEKAKPKVYRNIKGQYEKWELVTSHICRRSFATNFYAETPTALLINITAHSTEKQFLAYIGKPAKDFSVQLAEFWNKENLKAKKEPQIHIIKKAN